MTERKTFVSNVISGRMINVPEAFADHHDIQKGDSVEISIESHKRDGEELLNTEDSE